MTTEHDTDILLVEDSPHDAELAMRALKSRHLTNRVVWVKDGAEAINYLFGSDSTAVPVPVHTPRVILLDLKLPKMDGREVLRRIKGDARTKLVPVVVLTSSREEQDIVESYKLGVNSYIVKPVEFENFSEAVAQLGMYWLLLNQPPVPVSLLPRPKG